MFDTESNDWDKCTPTVLVVADRPARGRRLAEIVARGGNRVIDVVEPANAELALDGLISLDAVMLDVTCDHGDVLDALTARIERATRHNRYAAAIAMSRALIDPVTAQLSCPDAILLCEPTSEDCAIAIASATAWHRLRLNDVSSDSAAGGRLRELSEEVARIAQTLAGLSGLPNSEISIPIPPEPRRDDARTGDPAGEIRGIIRARRMRDQFFPAALFADPDWDMLLDLKAAQLENRDVSVSSLCIAAAVPATTALRHLTRLVESGLVVRVADPYDRRRVHLELSESASETLANYFTALKRNGLRTV